MAPAMALEESRPLMRELGALAVRRSVGRGGGSGSGIRGAGIRTGPDPPGIFNRDNKS
jgi:hypothetical protein